MATKVKSAEKLARKQERAQSSGRKLRVTLVKSSIGCATSQKRTVKALGLLKINAVIEHPDNQSVRGMIFKVQHLVKVEEI